MSIRNEIDINLFSYIKKVMNKFIINKKNTQDDSMV